MLGLNNVQLMGHSYQFKMSETNAGKSAASFSLMVIEKIGENEVKSFFWVNCYSGLADNLNKYWEDGKPLFVEGRINTYKKGDTNKYSITANNIKFI